MVIHRFLAYTQFQAREFVVIPGNQRFQRQGQGLAADAQQTTWGAILSLTRKERLVSVQGEDDLWFSRDGDFHGRGIELQWAYVGNRHICITF